MKIIDRIKIVFAGFRIFKLREFFLWLGWRSWSFKLDSTERLFRTRSGEKFYFRSDATSGAGYFQELYLQNRYFENYNLKDGDVVIDIGAHIGIFSIMAARSKDIRAFSYEPSPMLFSFLERNIKLNNLDGIIRAFPLAIADKEGNVEFYAQDLVSGTTVWEATRGTVDADKHITVQATTLGKIFDANRITRCDFLKMDCEGAEFTLLNTPSDVFRKILHIAVEYHLPPEPLVVRLKQEGFAVRLGAITGNNVGMLYADRK